MGLSVKWLGHASFQIKTDGKNIYIDPYEGRYTEKADVILVTHSHYDHCDVHKINEARKENTVIIAPADCAQRIRGDVRTLSPGDRVTVRGVNIGAVQAYNHKRFKSPGIPYHPRGLGVGYLLTIGDKTIYHAGDTDLIPEMRQLKDIYLALLPVGGTYTMDIAEAVEAAMVINPKVVIPMHILNADPMEFKRSLEARSQIKVVVLKPGQQFALQ